MSIRKTDADCLEFAKDGFGILLGICKRWISGQKHFAKGCPLKEKAAATRQLRWNKGSTWKLTVWKEIDNLKKDMNALMQELVKLK